jgi:Fe-Mn family superoxide dismutase
MTTSFNPQRRSLLCAAAATVAIAGTANAAGAAVAAGANPPLDKNIMPHNDAFDSQTSPKPLAFNAARLDGISERLILSHWENNYSGAVKALNVVKKQLAVMLANKDTPPFIYNDLKREHLMRTGSVVFHENYFDNLGGNGQAGAAERKAISEAFNGFDSWESEFRRIGVGLGGGSGWVVLGFNTHTRQMENYWLGDHAHGPAATLPLLVMDMYEHAYQMDYGAAAAKYIDAFFKNIQWETVASRLETAMRLT